MADSRRTAPDPEFVQLYRQGTPTSKIAAWASMAESAVRYHLTLAVKEDPGIREEHRAAQPAPKPRTPAAGLRNLADVLAFHQTQGRLPVRHGKTARERALGAWLARRRLEAAAGTLSPTYRDALAVIPGWDQPSTHKAEAAERWARQLNKLQQLRAGGSLWPRHQKTDDPDERSLGVWLHQQRIEYRAGRLDPAKEEKLNRLLPGWREGRGHRGGRRPGTTPE